MNLVFTLVEWLSDIAAWVDLSTRFGKLPFATLFEPAIDRTELIDRRLQQTADVA